MLVRLGQSSLLNFCDLTMARLLDSGLDGRSTRCTAVAWPTSWDQVIPFSRQVQRSGPRSTLTSWSVTSPASPDLTKGKRFLDKLHDQLAHASPEAVQLMAELHAVHFLIIWTGAISAAKKRSDLEAIVSWMPVPCAVPADVLDAMAPGIVHPGQWVMTRRDTQLTWLIRFSRAWKDLPGERQRLLIEDPWAMKAFAEAIFAPSSDSARLALLHLAHPDTFEPIVSPDHKRLITERFADEARSDADIDRRLLAARAALTAQYGESFDWYADPLVHRWWKDRKTWPAFLDLAAVLRDVPRRHAKCPDRRADGLPGEVRRSPRPGRWLATPAGPARSKAFTGWTPVGSRRCYALSWAGSLATRPAVVQALPTLWWRQPGSRRPAAGLPRACTRLQPSGTQKSAGISSWLLMEEDPAVLPPTSSAPSARRGS